MQTTELIDVINKLSEGFNDPVVDFTISAGDRPWEGNTMYLTVSESREEEQRQRQAAANK